MACDKNVLDIPVSASIPASTDYVIFTLADGTSVIRTWANIAAAFTALPDDAEFTVLASGSNIDNFINGNNQVILTNFVGRKIRLNRGSVPQFTSQGNYTWNLTTGELNVFPAPVTGEFFAVQAYK